MAKAVIRDNKVLKSLGGKDAYTAMLCSAKNPIISVDDPEQEAFFPELEDDPMFGTHSGRRIFTEIDEIPDDYYFGEPDENDYREIGFAAEDGKDGLLEKYTAVLNHLPVTVTPFPVDEEEVARMRRESERKIYDEQHSRLVANGYDPLSLFNENGYKVGQNPLSMVGQKRFLVIKGIMSSESFDRFLKMTTGPYVRKRFKFAKISSKYVNGAAVHTVTPV